MTDNRTTELTTTVEALTALASAITWTVPNSAPSVEKYLKDAWTAIDKLKNDCDNRTIELISCRETTTLLVEFLCEYQYILLSHRFNLNADEVVCKQNELIDEYAERIAQVITATLRSELNSDKLPVGLTVSEDGKLLNWRGENYVKQSTLESIILYGRE
jgi:hypothetical protein